MEKSDIDAELMKYFTSPYLRLNKTFVIGSTPIAVGTFGEVRVGKIGSRK